MIIIYSENTIEIYTMTWNKIHVHILLIFYNINKHIEFLFLKPMYRAIFYNIYTEKILQLYKGYTTYFITLNYLHH